MQTPIEAHYDIPELTSHIRAALTAAGKRLDALTVDDLAPIDAMHARGRAATAELAALAALPAGTRVLDIGSGLGGSARYLASRFDCDVTGIDLTASFCETATELSAMVGLSTKTRFRRADALALPFHDASFDAVWTEHAQMNIPDKERFYAEAVRVLRPGGSLIFADLFAGPGGELHYPVPWADSAETSSLISSDELRRILGSLGLQPIHDHDHSDRTREAIEAARARGTDNGPLGIQVVLRRSVPEKFKNAFRNLSERRFVPLHGVWQKP